MTGLGEALEAAAKAAYGEGWDDLSAMEKMACREAVLPLLNVIVPIVKNGIADQLARRAESARANKSPSLAAELAYAEKAARAWH